SKRQLHRIRDGLVLSVSLIDIREASVPGSLIEITVAEDSSFSQKYTTNKEGIIPYIYAPLNSTLEFKINNRTCRNKLLMDKKLKSITLVDSNCKFNTDTKPHQVVDNPNDKNSSEPDKDNTVSNQLIETESDNQSKVDSVTFNIKLVEGDTGKPLPNTTYYLEYKNSIKPHKTDDSGIESGIKAEVSQSIGVYLDDDEGKKQSIYSMAFPVTGDLNGQTKVLRVPIVSFNIEFVDNNNQPIPHYEFKTLYRGRQSAIKRANSQGISTIKALAGQKLTIIDGQGRAQTTAIVTYGSKQWTMIIGTDITRKDISNVSDILSQEAPTTLETSEQDDTPKPQTKQDPVIKVEKPKVTEVEKKTETGPTLEVASDEAKITIKFVDEATNKPLSGLSYITQSTKYGKNTSVTGDDGTRGRTHDSLVGIDITVLVYEDGKEVKKDVITASVDRNDIPYVYKAKKPKNYLYPLPIDATADYKSGMRSFGSNRSGGKRKHAGADLYAPTGTTVRAMESGIVLSTGSFYAGTDFVTIKHPNHIIRYGELAPGSIKVEAEDEVARGQPIGAVGKLKGINVPSNMLHLEMYSNTNDTSNLTVKGAAGGKFKRRSDLINPNSFLDNADK
ncbi:M23 family metallopeptidase, partial [Psychrobacter celer]|uniref:M23 family metallopeptidase n=2 Tax=Psychrobacter celer TaxID=306572 RepID=UPI001D02504D